MVEYMRTHHKLTVELDSCLFAHLNFLLTYDICIFLSSSIFVSRARHAKYLLTYTINSYLFILNKKKIIHVAKIEGINIS